MSLAAPCLAIRNVLRSSLDGFYDNTDSAKQIALRKASCRVMPDERPAPNAGREFISIYASAWQVIDGDSLYGFHERVTITAALTHRYADVPFDNLGEAAYLQDEDKFVQQYASISSRLRQIAMLIHASWTAFNTEMAAILVEDVLGVDKTLQSQYDHLWFSGADSKPQIVGPDHFSAQSSDKAPSGLLMRANFTGAARLHGMPTLDYHAT